MNAYPYLKEYCCIPFVPPVTQSTLSEESVNGPADVRITPTRSWNGMTMVYLIRIHCICANMQVAYFHSTTDTPPPPSSNDYNYVAVNLPLFLEVPFVLVNAKPAAKGYCIGMMGKLP